MTNELILAVLASDANPTPAPWRVLTKMAFFIGLIGTLGSSLVYAVVVEPVLSRSSVDPGYCSACRRVASVVLACIGTWFLIALYFQIASVVARKGGTPVPYGDALAPAHIWQYLTAPAQTGQWISTGTEAALQYGLWAIAALVLMALWDPRLHSYVSQLARAVAGLALVAWLVTAIPTNLAKATLDNVADGFFDHLHVTAVATWVGGIALLTLSGLLTPRPRTSAAGEIWANLWNRFSAVALVAVACVLVSGSWLAWKLLGHPGELFSTSFGRFLLLKVSLVATMIAVGGFNEFLLLPRIARARAEGAEGSVLRLAVKVFPRLVALEAVLALGVLFVLSYLTGSARTEAGDDPDPMATGNVAALGAALIIVIGMSLIATSRVSARLSSTDDTEDAPRRTTTTPVK